MKRWYERISSHLAASRAAAALRSGEGKGSRLEFILCVTGVALVWLHAFMSADAAVNSRRDLARFELRNHPDTTLWAPSRLDEFRSGPQPLPAALIGVLVIRGIDLQAPLYADTSPLHLNRGVGLIDRMARPGAIGNLGIAGHRDGFFRSLKDIEVGETIELSTSDRSWRYRVASIEIVERTDTSLLRNTERPVLTLVTCYPFYFVGHAPRRFVVRGILVSSI